MKNTSLSSALKVTEKYDKELLSLLCQELEKSKMNKNNIVRIEGAYYSSVNISYKAIGR